jgi:hypothetical protein
MNTPEKIAQAYLRLNGFFTIPHFTTLKEEGGHIDFLAVRLAGSQEKVGVAPNQIPLKIDEDLLSNLDVTKDETIGLIIEVKGSKNKPAEIDELQFAYAKLFFGNLDKIKKVGFENRSRIEIFTRNDQIIITLKYCMRFIKRRFSELKIIEEDLRGNRLLSKEGSWELSEEFLSDLIYLEKL